jgi:hypothetical protein
MTETSLDFSAIPPRFLQRLVPFAFLFQRLFWVFCGFKMGQKGRIGKFCFKLVRIWWLALLAQLWIIL